MNRKLLVTSLSLPFAALLVASACSLEEDPGPNSTGGTSSGGSSTAGSAGSSSVSGSVGTSGSTGTSGASAGGTGGSGTAGAGGASGGSGGTGGTGGTGVVDLVELVTGKTNNYGFALKDSWHIIPCVDKQAHDCYPIVGGSCPNTNDPVFLNRGVKFEEEFEVGGEVGKSYDVTIRVNGIAEAKYYRNGTRRAGDSVVGENQAEGTDTWYIGGEPIPSSYNVVQLTVLKPDGSELEHYYLNSWPQDSGNEAHETFSIGYDATFEVIGGGKIKYLNQDSNCRAINNCGIGDNGSACDNARVIPNEPGLQLPAMYGGKSVASMNAYGGQAQPYHAQAIHITVKNVVAK